MKRKLFTSLCFSLVLLISCDDKDVGMSVSTSDITLNNITNETTFDIDCNQSWSIGNNFSWCHVSPDSGNGSKTISVSVDPNNETSARTAYLKLSTGQTVVVKQEGASLKLSKKMFSFDTNSDPETLEITSNTSWSFIAEDSWCEFNPQSGTGDAVVTLTPKPFADRVNRLKTAITVNFGKSDEHIYIQQTLPNKAPSKPKLLTPTDYSAEQSVLLSMTWDPSVDPDGDEVNYTLAYSTDKEHWSYTNPTLLTRQMVLSPLKKNMTYYWKIIAEDSFNGITESDLYSFTTGDLSAYKDGESRVYQENTKGNRPVNILFMGDGFIAEDFNDGGAFDQIMNEAIEDFFSIEPYITYRDYFRVQKVAAYSKDRGQKDLRKNHEDMANIETVFRGNLDAKGTAGVWGTKVFEYAVKADGITEGELSNMTIVVIGNYDAYGGSCFAWNDGKSIGFTFASRTTNKWGQMDCLIHHECGGHGWGHLSDEYVYDNDKEFTNVSGVTSAKERGQCPNISVIRNRDQVEWAKYFTIPGYEMVGYFEGALTVGKGVWRAENKSCMVDNRPHYSAPGREAIVRRIMDLNDIPFDFDDFIEKDKAALKAYDNIYKTPNRDKWHAPYSLPIVLKDDFHMMD